MNREEILKRYGEGERSFSGANLRGAYLSDADLRYANLSDADLSGANLRGANLRGANLLYANLSDANLRDANLRGANLLYANLRYADLSDANLRGANLRYADLSDANLPCYPMLLLASWGDTSISLCIKLMRYDAANLTDAKVRFEKWITGLGCPLAGSRTQRSASFNEISELIDDVDKFLALPIPTALELVQALFKENGIKHFPEETQPPHQEQHGSEHGAGEPPQASEGDSES